MFLRFRENKVDFQILKMKDLCDKVIFFKICLYAVLNLRILLRRQDFCKAVDIMKVKGHLTNEGLDQLNKLKKGMNTGRK